ncbi:MAG: sulfotransferase [Gemmatimonadetes bacterium]|nr:sulfotransferase [Gemmatimonadota bacterium]MBA4160321.1 sulfotransferase [Gemmatimonadota bacterium]
MPAFWRKFDDPRGIIWRVRNAILRFSPRRTARFLAGYLQPLHYERPVFILGVPRSGTTFLFHLLRESRELAGLPREGHDAWRAFHHPRSSGWRSDAVGSGEIRTGERRFINAYFYSYLGQRRFVEKTPENCLRVPYLLDLFPDAHFIVVKRNPCDVINSLINGWRHPEGRYRSYFVPVDLRIPGYPHRRQWCFALIGGWRELTAAPIPRIAFAQWKQCSEGWQAARPLVSPARWTEIYFEDLLSAPEETLSRICERIGIEMDRALEAKLADLLVNPVNALSPPGADKWRREHREEVTRLLPEIAAASRSSGYRIDPDTGEYEICR